MAKWNSFPSTFPSNSATAGSFTFCTFLLSFDSGAYDFQSAFPTITSCCHAFFWSVYSEICYVSTTCLYTPNCDLPSWWFLSPNVTWIMPYGILGRKFSLRNFLLGNLKWKDGGSWRRGGDTGTRLLCASSRSKLYENILRVSEQWNQLGIYVTTHIFLMEDRLFCLLSISHIYF